MRQFFLYINSSKFCYIKEVTKKVGKVEEDDLSFLPLSIYFKFSTYVFLYQSTLCTIYRRYYKKKTFARSTYGKGLTTSADEIIHSFGGNMTYTQREKKNNLK